MKDLRVGHGFDIHQVCKDRSLILGGVPISEGPGLAGHSDADVLVHALMDAILGALGQPDIGALFPNTDERYFGISSMLLLEEVIGLLGDWQISNVDLTVVAERPKILKYRDQIRVNLAEALNVSPDQVGLKATTAEQLGAIGRGEGMQAFAVVLLVRF